MEKISLEFLAKQNERILDEMGNMRDDMQIMAAMIQRMDGTMTGLINEVRAEHSRSDRQDKRLRRLEEGRKA